MKTAEAIGSVNLVSGKSYEAKCGSMRIPSGAEHREERKSRRNKLS